MADTRSVFQRLNIAAFLRDVAETMDALDALQAPPVAVAVKAADVARAGRSALEWGERAAAELETHAAHFAAERENLYRCIHAQIALARTEIEGAQAALAQAEAAQKTIVEQARKVGAIDPT